MLLRGSCPVESRHQGVMPRCPSVVCRLFVQGFCLFVGLAVIAARGAEPQPPLPTDAAFFDGKVGPLLASRCIGCHGPDVTEGGLRLDSLAGLAAGGRSGPVIRPGVAEESLLLQAVQRLDESLAMPPDEPLTPAEVDTLAAWIAGGAVHPHGVIRPADSPPAGTTDHWSLLPLETPAVPTFDVSREHTSQHAVDAFIFADLSQRGLTPTAPADRHTLIRRLSFTLTGLPPTPDEVDAFVADKSPQAFDKIVERLLASPHYGEHWARHWLDVVRYADSNGLDENVAHGNAWRYRDWCIRAFNDDMPFDDFLRAQIAGDLLAADREDEAERVEMHVATGFLSLGPKSLAEGDQTKLAMDIIDEQIDTLGRSVLGMSLGCARCHDHKFDPVTQRDYYALAGIFKSTQTMDSLKRLATWHEHVIAPPAARQAFEEHQQRIAAATEAIEAYLTETRRQLAAAKPEGQGGASGTAADTGKIPEKALPEAARSHLAKLREKLKQLEADAPSLDSAMGVAEGKPEETRIHVRGSHLMLGSLVPRGVPAVLQFAGPVKIPPQGSGRRELADWIVDPRHPLTARVLANRVWRWHFGRGLVRSTDNFGTTGEPPTNQPLLDWLAAQLVESGWSLKSLHRLILSSRTWQQSSDSATSPTAAAALHADPDNTLWWRADVRRLEAESIRDAMLASSGLLDRTAGGSLLQVANRAFVFNHLSKDDTRYDSRRRSIYLPVIRNHIHDALWLFDCTDGAICVGDRPTSTVASQALYLLNSEFVIDTAASIAAGIVAAAPDDFPSRLLLLFRRLFGRPPTAAEEKAVRRAIDRLEKELGRPEITAADRNRAAWTAVCQTLLVSDDFLMLR